MNSLYRKREQKFAKLAVIAGEGNKDSLHKLQEGTLACAGKR